MYLGSAVTWAPCLPSSATRLHVRSLSSALLQMMGGRFCSVMPSNLVYPGACAIESLPAPGSEYASHAAKGELRRLFARLLPLRLERFIKRIPAISGLIICVEDPF